MARQECRVQLKQSDMRLALNMAKIAKGGLSPAAIKETQHRIQKPHAKVSEEKKWRVEFPAYGKVTTGLERHPAMVR